MLCNLIMPMAGAGSRFLKNGIRTPKPLIDLSGKPFFVRSLESVWGKCSVDQLVFAVLKAHVRDFGVDQIISQYFPSATILILEDVLNGPVYTLEKCMEEIRDRKLPVLVNDCDHYFQSEHLLRFLNGNPKMNQEVGVLFFNSKSPQYSYLEYNADKLTGVVEKQPVSDRAICGAYLFRDAEVIEKLIKMARKKTDSELYLSFLLNEVCKTGGTFLTFNCEKHLSFGTPEELKAVLESRFFE